MAKKLWTRDINEFLDWISGENSLTKLTDIDTKSTPISGQSIRKLIQSHLRKPFSVLEYDNRKLLFSSEAAQNKWYQALSNNDFNEETLPKAYQDLVLLDFDVPPAHKLIIKKNTAGENLSTINVLEGSNDKGVLSFVYYLDDDSASTTTPVEIIVSVYDNITKEITKQFPRNCGPEYCDGQHVIEFYLGDYLKSGSNTIGIQIRSTDNTLKAQQVDTSIQMNLISFNIDVEFEGSKSFNNPFIIGEYISFRVISTRSITDNVTESINVYVDDFSKIATNGPISTSGWNTTYNSKSIQLTNNYEAAQVEPAAKRNIKHKVLIQANMQSADHTINFDSNFIYFEFENRSLEIDGVNNAYINVFTSIPAGALETDAQGNKCLIAYQYNKYILRWGFYTDSAGTNTNPDVKWVLRVPDTSVAGQDYKDNVISALSGDSGNESESLIFVPDTPYAVEDNARLLAIINRNGVDTIVFDNPIVIIQSEYEITFNEFKGYALKLSAYGRSNSESEETVSSWKYGAYTTTFSQGFPWDLNNGWNNNALSLIGTDNYATVNFNPFPTTGSSLAANGRAIEIDFMPTSVANNDDALITIGSDDGVGGCIKIYPSKASLYVGTSEKLTTNYKSNERIQLTFIFIKTVNNDAVDAGYIYIVNNGILERGVGGVQYTQLPYAYGKIKFGGTESGIKIYNMRVWWNQMSIYDAFLNYLYDCDNKGEIISRNTMAENNGQDINYSECTTKIDTFLLEGNLDQLFNAQIKDESESAVNITYSTIKDNNVLGWTATDVRIRKHGQSTLNYPIPSFKIWLNKSKGENKKARVNFKDQYKINEYVKNRYTLRKGSIPANKFVLQANYADSSGVHNGGLLRLINDTWYNANFGDDKNPKYLLRTPPQLFTSGQTIVHNDAQLNETGWIEGYGNTNKIFGGLAANEHTWPELAKAYKNLDELPTFKFKIRNAPDSTPCVVFYKKSANDPQTYLGQFVFMDDKKSDHIYGERSIYLWDDINDPFCMTDRGANTTVINSDGVEKNGYDRDANCVWENKNVLRIECVLINSSLTSFMDFNVSESLQLDENGDPIGDTTGTIPADTIQYKLNKDTGQEEPVNYYWEDYFEIIYPDDEDIADEDGENGLTKFSGSYKQNGSSDFPANTSKFIKKTQPWIDFLKWICSIGQLNHKANGEPYIDGTVTQAALDKFKAEAHEHLDLYKLAAYYIFFIRFGLVDSVERNAQYKTYDGQHWFIEPWDMDIALGNKNTGGLVYDPPLTRDSRMPDKPNVWAYSGRSTSTSNVMWDCLEAWDYWMTSVVPKVADALYKAGLTYKNVTEMFDGEYANKWSEVLYNNSGMYKYVTAAQDKDWLGWLQGSRTSHRHWWVSTSMNYYDSKWTCGEFNQSRLYLAVNKAQGQQITINLWPTSDTYFKMTQKDGETDLGLKQATRSRAAQYVLDSYAFTAKDPTHIFGILFLEKLDLGDFAAGIEKMIFQNAVDDVLGATIKEINIGSTIPVNSGTYGWVNGGDISISNTASISDLSGNSNIDALENVETFNATGQLKISESSVITNKRTKLKNIYAAGTGFTALTSSKQGNKYENVQLPAYNRAIQLDNSVVESEGVTALVLNNSSWNNLTFWNCEYNANSGWVNDLDINGEIQYELDDNGNPTSTIKKKYIEQNVTYTKLNKIPKSFQSVEFTGSTASNMCTAQFILDWFDSIEYYVQQENPSLSGDVLEAKVLEEINKKTATIKNIRWNYNIDSNDPNYITLTYKDVIRLGNLNGGINQSNGISSNANGQNFTGYIKIGGSNMESWQLAELIKYFGENVFTIGNIGNNLVIDQASEYARISVSGGTLINNEIYIDEGEPIKLRCTSFLLSAENANNYDWVTNSAHGSITGRLVGDGDYYQITCEETMAGSNYDISITATSKTNINNSTSITIHVKPVTVCTNWEFKWSTLGNNNYTPRKYSIDETVARSLFGNTYAFHQIDNVNTLCDAYIFYRAEMVDELYISPVAPSGFNGNNPLDAYNATIKNIRYRFETIPSTSTNINEFTVRELANGLTGMGWTGADLSGIEEYAVNHDNNSIVLDTNNQIIRVNKTATRILQQSKQTKNGNDIITTTKNFPSGVVFETYSTNDFITKTKNMLMFRVTATVVYESGSISEQNYSCNIILFDDATAIISNQQGSGRSLIAKLQNDYPGNYTGVIQLYKSDLISVKGTLSFASNANNLGTLKGLNTVTSLFDFMPNVEIIDLTGTTFAFTEISNYFNFDKLKAITKIKLTNASNAITTINTTGAVYLEEIHLDGTQVNLRVGNNPSLELIKLGSPETIYIGADCPLINDTNVSCESSANLISLDIINNSNTTTFAYKLFDKIYNPVEETEEEEETT